MITCAWQQNKPLKGFIVRKEAKAHGTGQQVEGPVDAGQRAIMVEGVIITGGISLKAIKHALAAVLSVDRLTTSVDRRDNSATFFESVGVQFIAFVHVSELGV